MSLFDNHYIQIKCLNEIERLFGDIKISEARLKIQKLIQRTLKDYYDKF